MNNLQIFEKDPLHWAILFLWKTNPEEPEKIDYSIVYSVLENHLAKSPVTEKARMSERLYEKISDTAAFQQIMTALRLHRPLAANNSIHSLFNTEDRKSWRYLTQMNKGKILAPWAAFLADLTRPGSLIKSFEAVPLPSV